MKLKKELPLIGIVLLPFLYLTYVWKQLPSEVPLHWNIKGEVDRYGDRSELILIPILTSLLIYVIFLAAPYIDPKKQIQKMGKKYDTLKWIITTFMSVLALFIIYTAKNQSIANPNYILLLCGILFIIFGNYFKTIKANYFIGIRTPWTLENESVWKETHKLGGKIWFAGGLLVILSSLIFNEQTNFIIFMTIIAVMVLVPVVYSYLLFRKQKD
ncbi:SdpI family protein [Flagellimonas halotolerans]|uniref:SdpI family protein n=1 Tax=Flagellimonas halotolerans TaxID=3112164 RepID=A0ABU6IP31_9FLAO|nr:MULTISPECIES: SdpI family protein [unclassified Allomuricauda]MEC3964768.1 SdpI family protein [Muricauda sp. SYSU M86414]MEC4264868.1 SdpI family protein [Muricauda sp. SYSU M84420]